MKTLVGFVLKVSTNRLVLPSMLVFCIVNYSVLLLIRGRIAEQIGVPPFDFGGELRIADVYEQLPLYTESTRALYRLFFVSDVLAPLGESFLFLLVLAAALRGGPEPLRRLLIRINATVLALVPIGVDGAENVGFLIAIERYPVRSELVVSLAILFRQARIALLPIVLGCLLLTLGICLWWQRRTERDPRQVRAKAGLVEESP